MHKADAMGNIFRVLINGQALDTSVQLAEPGLETYCTIKEKRAQLPTIQRHIAVANLSLEILQLQQKVWSLIKARPQHGLENEQDAMK